MEDETTRQRTPASEKKHSTQPTSPALYHEKGPDPNSAPLSQHQLKDIESSDVSSGEHLKEVEVNEDLDTNIQVAGRIPLASWLIIVSKFYLLDALNIQRHALRSLA